MTKRPRSLDAAAHLLVRGLEHGGELMVGDVGERPPGRYAGVPERLGLPDVADPRDEALVEQCVADLALLRRGAEALEYRVEVGRVREDVRSEPAREARAAGGPGAPP